MTGLSVEQIRELLRNKPNFANETAFFLSSLGVYRTYCFNRCAELRDMVRFLGAPTVFFTLSSAKAYSIHCIE